MNTTRRYPRTLQEAFPHDSRHAYAVERVASRTEAFWGVVLACAIGIGLALVVAYNI